MHSAHVQLLAIVTKQRKNRYQIVYQIRFIKSTTYIRDFSNFVASLEKLNCM